MLDIEIKKNKKRGEEKKRKNNNNNKNLKIVYNENYLVFFFV